MTTPNIERLTGEQTQKIISELQSSVFDHYPRNQKKVDDYIEAIKQGKYGTAEDNPGLIKSIEFIMFMTDILGRVDEIHRYHSIMLTALRESDEIDEQLENSEISSQERERLESIQGMNLYMICQAIEQMAAPIEHLYKVDLYNAKVPDELTAQEIRTIALGKLDDTEND